MNCLRSFSLSTPDGDFTMLIDAADVVRASGFGDLAGLAARLPRQLQTTPIIPTNAHPYAQAIADYYDGDAAALTTIRSHQEGSPFQLQVWQSISSIPQGQTISYKQLAEAAGNPAAVRAAGTACGSNRLILLVPCHRVLKSDGGVGSYLYGSEIKMSLLHRERVL